MLKNINFRVVEYRKSAGNKRKRNRSNASRKALREEVIEKV